MQATLLPSISAPAPRSCRPGRRARAGATAPAPSASAADSAAPAAAAAAPSGEAAIYEGVYNKPLGVKFARGNDGGAYVISKSADPAYDQFTVGDKILEVRRVCLTRWGGARKRWPDTRARGWTTHSGGPAHAARLLCTALQLPNPP